MARDQTETKGIEDTMLVAWMQLQGFAVTSWISSEPGDRNVRVSFDIEGDPDAIEASMRTYYDNTQVGVQDFVRAVKRVKSEMYAMQKLGRSKREQKGDRT